MTFPRPPDEQWGYVGAKSRQRWLFYAYDRLRKTVVAHVFGERTLATLERLLSLLSAFEVVVWMTDGWPLYESRLKGKLHVISKRYTQRIERHNLNLRQHLARLGRKSLSFSKSVELHDKVIGHYLNINTGGYMTLAELGMAFWHDLAAPVIAGILASMIVNWLNKRK